MSIFLSFLLAFISIIYEFTLAQIIALFHGNTFTIYSITIGLYTFSLGFGALFFEVIKDRPPLKTLFNIELLLSLSSLLSPFLIVFASGHQVRSFSETLMYILVFLPIIICGFLSGIELPSLLALNKKEKGSILLWDYIGMFLGALLFGSYVLEKFGPIKLMWMMVLLNSLGLGLLLLQPTLKMNVPKIVAVLSLLGASLLFIFLEELFFNYFRAFYGF